ncbi:uncharacterized protein LOC144037805 [Vanacampus margaritifer]
MTGRVRTREPRLRAAVRRWQPVPALLQLVPRFGGSREPSGVPPPEDEMGMVLDAAYLYTCAHKEVDADTKQVYFSLSNSCGKASSRWARARWKHRRVRPSRGPASSSCQSAPGGQTSALQHQPSVMRRPLEWRHQSCQQTVLEPRSAEKCKPLEPLPQEEMWWATSPWS